MKRFTLGISCYYHDSAAALICEGEILGAVQEERFSRLKNDAGFPVKSIEYLLENQKIQLSQVDNVIYYEKPFLTFERLMASYIHRAPFGLESFLLSVPIWIKKKLFLRQNLIKELSQFDGTFNEKKLLFSEHHLSHAAGSFYTSGFDEAVILVLDGVGEWATASVAIGRRENIIIEKEIRFPNSLGLLYSSFTAYLGFEVNEGEYKMMGLAPYGRPRFAELIKKEIVDIKEDGSFRLNLKLFNFVTGLTMTNKKFHSLFGEKTRAPNEPLSSFHADVAASIQNVTEEIILKIVRALSAEYKIKNLCLSGGVALNCVANGKIVDTGVFKEVWVQPSSGDAGGALGAALVGAHMHLQIPREASNTVINKNPYIGPQYSQREVEDVLKTVGAVFQVMPFSEVLNVSAKALSLGKVVGWFQGGLEFGPRALGNRSILADPSKQDMQKKINLKVKYREGFRPFAPAVLSEFSKDWFNLQFESPYMLFVREVNDKKRISGPETNISNDNILNKLSKVISEIPAVTHVDFSARVQTVTRKMNPKFYDLIKHFYEITGYPLLVNTSMNVRGEPIVCDPIDAFKCLMTAQLDYMVIGNCLLKRSDQYDSFLIGKKDSVIDLVRETLNVEKHPNTKIIKVGEKSEVTKKVEKFYSPNPFPNYNDEQTIADLNENLENNIFLKALKKKIGLGKKVLEVGAGTSQLSIVLAYGTNNLNVAFDPTLESIKLGEAFARKNQLQNCEFIVGDIFDNPFKNESFDFVWSSGVLHHTENPREGFKIISRWLKKDGYIVIGLYNHIGRARTIFRQRLNNLLGDGVLARRVIYILDPILRGNSSDQQKASWHNDQYRHPVESVHSISEVLQWFDEENIEFISSTPHSQGATDNYDNLFLKQDRGSFISRLISEFMMIFGRHGGEGGLFVVVGKKNPRVPNSN